MMFGLILAMLLDETPNPNATPPPTIITTKSSPLCKAVRDVVAPAVFGLQTQDRGIQHGHALLNDMALLSVLRGNGTMMLDQMRLLNDVDHIAANNIKIHQLLDQLDDIGLRDPQEIADVKRLQRVMRNVADHQANALNAFSGSADTKAMRDLGGFQNPMSFRFVQQRMGLPPEPNVATPTSKYDNLITASPFGGVAKDVGYIEFATSQSELNVAPALESVISRCI